MDGKENLSESILEKLEQSERDVKEKNGVFLKELPIGTILNVQTKNTLYTIEIKNDGPWISGHPSFCPTPRRAHIPGSTWGGSMLKAGWIGLGMCMEFHVEPYIYPITTSPIQEIAFYKEGEEEESEEEKAKRERDHWGLE